MNFNISSMHTIFEAASSSPIVNQDINTNPKEGEANDTTGENLNNSLSQADLNAIFDDICPISGDVYASLKNAASDPKNLKIAMVKSGDGEKADLFIEAVEFATYCEAADCTVGEAVENIIEAYGEEIPELDNADFHVVFPSDSANKDIIGGENLGRAIKNDWAMQLMRGCRRYGLKVNAGVSVEPSEEKEMLGESSVLNEGLFGGGNKEREDIVKNTKKVIADFLTSNGFTSPSLSTIGAKGTGDFKKGKGNTVRYFLSNTKSDAGYMSEYDFNRWRSDALRAINQEKASLSKDIKEATGKKVSKLSTEASKLNMVYVVVEFDI